MRNEFAKRCKVTSLKINGEIGSVISSPRRGAGSSAPLYDTRFILLQDASV